MRDRLYRSRDERVIFGVCGGVADWLDIDPSLVRIAFALLTVSAGIGLVLYIVMALVVPEEAAHLPDAGGPESVPGDPMSSTGQPAQDPAGTGPTAPLGATPGLTPQRDRPAERQSRRAARRVARGDSGGRGAVILGAVLVLVGAWFLVRRYLPSIDDELLGPAILILIGVLLVGGALRKSSDGGSAGPR